MPLVSTISFISKPTSTGTGFLFQRSESRVSSTYLISNSGIVTTGSLFLSDNSLEDEVTMLQSNNALSDFVYMQTIQDYITELDLNVLTQQELTAMLYMELVVGDLPPSEIARKSYVNLVQEESHPRFLENLYLIDISRYHVGVGYLEQVIVPSSIYILSGTQSDATGPKIVNEVPASGTTFNNPNASISFELRDLELTNINPVTVQLYINGIQVVNSGNALSPSGFGLTTFQQVSPTFYLFNFTPSGAFTLGSFVTVSGEARDSLPPSGNLSIFNYSYKVWDQNILSAIITGLPDAQSPYLVHLEPDVLEAGVPIDSNIEIDIVDDHTGLDPNSVLITIEGDIIISGGLPIHPLYNVTASSISGGKGMSYIIDPDDNFVFAQTVDVHVEAQDLFTLSPNILNYDYSFTTVDNNHLLASGLQVYVSGIGYVDMNVLDSFNSVDSGTDFKIKFYNFEDAGINTSGSYITCNGATVSGVIFVAVSGQTEYDVFFNLVPDYSTDADLIFHIQQLPLVSGNVVYKEFQAELLWGAEYCYNPDSNFSYDTQVPLVFMVSDLGDTPKTDILVTDFNTVPFPKNDLYAEIIGIDVPTTTISASLVSNNPFFEYGKTMNVTIELEDFAGNKLIYPYKFKIQNKD